MGRELGFTLIELIIVIMIIGILLTVSTFATTGILVSSRDSERADDTASIARLLEDDYTSQIVGSPSYPQADQFVNDSKNLSGTAVNADANIFKAPNASGNVMVSATTNNAQNPRGVGSPSLNEYVYQPLDSSNNLCNRSGQVCVRFRLSYRQESNKQTVILRSAHQQ